jgi:CRP-like cAMP-binding protein
MRCVTDPRENHLLASLLDADLQHLLPQLERVVMPLGQVLHESGFTQNHLYFPTSAVVSLMCMTEDGATAEIAVVGNEGVVGISQIMGGGTTTIQAVVQGTGEGFQLKAQTMKEEFNRSSAVRGVLLRYTQALMTQMAQTAVCNRHHSVDQQFCRLLLLCLDRLQGKELVMTQESLAHMLGVRREGVTGSAGKLQRAGLINCTRGHILVLDREGIEKRTCECYAVVKKEYDRLLPKAEVKVPSGAEGRLPLYAQVSSAVPPWAASLGMKSVNPGNKLGAIGRACRIVRPSPSSSSR